VFWSGNGMPLGEVANGVRLEDGTVSVCVKRGELQRVLREEAVARGSLWVSEGQTLRLVLGQPPNLPFTVRRLSRSTWPQGQAGQSE
jgi:hypothetical protein